MGFLTDVVEGVRERLERRPLDASGLLSTAMRLPPARRFEAALREASPPGLIAEVKRASPSAGRIADLDPGSLARVYEAAGATAVSVLTEPHHFDGSLADLRAVHLSVGIPVLRKDFLIHPAQLIEARVAGADAALLIAAALSGPELTAMLAAAADLGLDCLVETHSEQDVEKAVAAGASVVGVNARDLETLEVDLDRALALVPLVPDDRLVVLESGVAGREHVERALRAGARAVLVGESLVRAEDPAAVVRALRGTT